MSLDTDFDIATGRSAALAFLANGDPAALLPLALPAAETAHFAEKMRQFNNETQVAAILLGGAAHWLALQGNPAFGFGAASVVSDYWRNAVPPKSNPTAEALLRSSYASSFGHRLITMAIACNRAGWLERTISLASEWEGRDPAPIGGKQVAVHLGILAAEAHWLKGDFEAARSRIENVEEPKEQPGAAALWQTLRRRLDELTQRARDSEQSSLRRSWSALCAQTREQLERAVKLAPIDLSTTIGAEIAQNIQSLYDRLEQEAASPPASEAERVRRTSGLMQAVKIIMNPAAKPKP